MLEVFLDLCFLIADPELRLLHLPYDSSYHPFREVSILHAYLRVRGHASVCLPSDERVYEVDGATFSLEIFEFEPRPVSEHNFQ